MCVEIGVWGSMSEATVQEDCSHNKNGGQSKREGTSNEPWDKRNQEHWGSSGYGADTAAICSGGSSSSRAASIAVWNQ